MSTYTKTVILGELKKKELGCLVKYINSQILQVMPMSAITHYIESG